MKLTDIQIKRIRPNANPFKLSDGGGLFLWVTPSGGRIWRWAYRYEGRAKLMTFGKYPDVPLSLARERHAEARKLLATGTDHLAKQHGHELFPTGEPLGVELGLMLLDCLCELSAWKKSQKLRVDTAYLCHGGFFPPLNVALLRNLLQSSGDQPLCPSGRRDELPAILDSNDRY